MHSKDVVGEEDEIIEVMQRMKKEVELVQLVENGN